MATTVPGNPTAPSTAVTPGQRFGAILRVDSVRDQFNSVLDKESPSFIASLIDLYNNDKTLQECSPQAVIMEALKAASLKLPINKGLGLAYILPYRNKRGQQEPQFQIGYKGLIQLAMRTGQYKYINADMVYEGELKRADKLTGEVDLNGVAKSDKVIGYFAYIETLNGFRKTLYWPTEKVLAHAKRYSKSYGRDTSPWKTNFDEMALKTMLRNLISKYGIMSIEMTAALTSDMDERTTEARVEDEINENANSQVIDIEPLPIEENQPQGQPQMSMGGPGF